MSQKNITMTFDQYKQTIDSWHKIAEREGLTLSTCAPLPVTFWKTFLGIKRRVHQEMYAGTHRVKSERVMPYLVRSIHFANKLPLDVFVEEARKCIPIFEANKID